MEKMIAVINDNLKSVINGIKTHKADTEKSLATIKAEMDDKVSIASDYRLKVEDARTIISSLENEISELENDLNDLNVKFGSKNFKEILAAGNKEINTKIIEKRALITEQSQKIIELTDKAHILKEDLVKLKEKKSNAEATLNKASVLEKYYENRIMSIIDFSEQHPEELKDYAVDSSAIELMSNSDEFENVDIKNVIDGSIFEEIDEISSTDEDINEDLIKEVLVPDDEEDDDSTTSASEDALSMTQQLDDIILKANDLIEKGNQAALENKENENSEENEQVNEEETTEEEPEVTLEEEPEKEEKVEEEVEEPEQSEDVIDLHISDDLDNVGIADNNIVMPTVDGVVIPANDEKIEDNTNDVSDAVNDIEFDDIDLSLNIESDELEDVPETTSEDLVDEDTMNADLANMNLNAEDDKNDNLTLEPSDDEDDDNATVELIIENDDEIASIPEIDITGVNVKSGVINHADFEEELKDCNLDIDRFSEEDLDKVQRGFNKENTIDFVNVMRKHNVAVSRLYESVDVFLNVTPQNLDIIMSALEETHASSDAISYVFDSFDKIDVNKLEKEIEANKNVELCELLYKVIPYEGESNIVARLGLNETEEMELRKNTTLDEFKIMNLFPDIVMANFNELKKYNVDNLMDCITKHPHRFIMNPDNFAGILDKYDPEDLTRCINKNAAVIDKL